MKRIILLLIVLCCTITMLAQNGNSKISYQAVVRDSENHLVYNTELQVVVSISNSENGPAVYSERHTVMSNINGLISLLIGNGEWLGGSWDNIQWNAAWVTTEISEVGETTVLAEHELSLNAVPYALVTDYADSVDMTMIEDYLEENGYITNTFLCRDVLDCIKDTLGHYTTSDNIDTLLGAYYDTTQMKTAIHDTAEALRASIPSSQVNADWDATDGPAEILHKPDLSEYVTNVHLNDTLSNYYTKNNIDSKLNDYLTKDGLCDSIRNCEVITNLQDADLLLYDRITQNSIALSEKIHSDSAYLKGLIDNNTTSITNNTTNITNNTTNITNNTTNISNITNNISNITNNITSLQAADSVLNDRITQDSIALANRLDTMLTHICDSIEQCDIITNLQKADSALSARITADSTNLANNYYNKIKINDTIAHILSQMVNTTGNLNDNYYTKDEINDTLSHYTTSNSIDSLLGNYATNDTLKNYLTIDGLCDSIKKCEVITNLQNTDSVLLTRIISDSVLFNRTDSVLLAHILNDSIMSHQVDSILLARILSDSTNLANNYYTSQKIDDTLSHYTTIDDINSLLGDYAKKDTLENYLTIDGLCDSIENCDVFANLQTSVTNNTTNISNITNNITSLQLTDSALYALFTQDSIALSNRLDTMFTHICDSIEQCDIITNLQKADSALSARITADSIRSHNADSVLSARIINDSVIFYKTDSVLLAHILNDSVLSHQADSILLARILSDSTNLANNYYNKNKINDTLSHYTTSDQIDSLLGNYATNDTLKNYLTIDGLCDSIKNCDVLTNLQDSVTNNTTKITNITNITNNNTTNITNNTTNINNLQSADSAFNARITNDSIALSKRMDTLFTHLCDSIEKCDIISNLQKSDSLLNVRITSDSILFHNADSVLSARIKADSTNLKDHYYTETQVDSIANKVRGEIGKGKLTIQYGTNSVVEFGANQDTNTSVIVPATVAELSDASQYLKKNDLCTTIESQCTNVPLKDADNTFTGANDFTTPGTSITVPSKFDIKNPPTSSTCTQDAVNICDLLAVFDSLSKRIKELEDDIAAINQPTTSAVSVSLSDITKSSIKATATMSDPNLNVTSYEFCISESSSMSNTTCGTSTSNEYIFTGLKPNTIYYVTVKAFHSSGSPTSDVASGKTLPITFTVEGPQTIVYSCGETETEPHYTAILGEGENADDYTFVWTVSNETVENVTTTTFDTSFAETVTEVTVVTKTVTCTATHNTLDYTLTGTVETQVTNNPYTIPTIVFCVNGLTITDMGSTNITQVKWGENNNDVFVDATTVDHTYTEPGVYTITAKSAEGCLASKEVNTNAVPLTPCSVPETHAAQLAANLPSGTTNGLEAVEGDNIISVKDYDGNMYTVVQIGAQCWMAENLRTTHYGDGTEITVGSSASAETPYIYYPNGETTNLNEYGYLYNWQAATYATSISDMPSGIQGVCPAGWHIPSEGEWQILDQEVNGSALNFNNDFNSDGNFTGKLAKGCSWQQSTEELAPGNFRDEQRNVTGFGAVPAGWYTSEIYTGFGSSAAFWTCTDHGENKIYTRHLNYNSSAMNRPSDDQLLNKHAYAVRCIRDVNYNPVMATVTANQSDITICSNESGDVTYTAKVTRYNKDFTNEYTYEWSVEGADLVANGSSCTVTYTNAGDYTVSCTVKQGTDVVAEKSVTTTVSVLQAPVFTTCEEGYDETNHGYLVRLMSLNQDATLDWGDNSSSTNVDVDTTTDINNGQVFNIVGTITHIYSAQGTPTITATSNRNGCAATKQIALGNTTIHACSSSLFTNHAQQAGTQVSGTNHYEGKEEINTDGDLVSVQDYDGNEYPVVQIGSQCWMAENLRTTHYADGMEITNGIGSDGSFTQAYYYPNNGTDVGTYGYFYNWYATTRGIPYSTTNPLIPGICPTGWHVPSTGDWNDLLTAADANNHAVKLAKSCDWIPGNTSDFPGDYNSLERNAYGFGAVPAGHYNFHENSVGGESAFQQGEYNSYGSKTTFWSSVESGSRAYYLILTSNKNVVEVSDNQTNNKVWGYSVRCVRNATNDNPVPVQMSVSSTKSGYANICGEDPAVVTYTAVINQNGTDIADQCTPYVWEVDGTTMSETGKSFTYTSSVPGTYTVTVSCTATIPGVGEREQSKTLTVSSGTIPGDFTISKDGNKVTVTLGTPKPVSVAWGDGSPDAEVHNSTTTVNHTYNENGIYPITAIASYQGCTRTKEVTIAAPVAFLEPASSEVSFCAGGFTFVEFTAQIKEGEDDVTSNFAPYTWHVVPQSGSPADGAQITTASNTNECSVTFSKPGTYTVSCTTATHNSVQLTKTATVIASYKAAPTFDDPTVSGRTVTLSNVVNTTSIDWGDETSTTEGIGETVSHTYSANSTGSGYHIIATSSVGCTKGVDVPVSLTMDEIGTTGTLGTCNNGSTTVIYNATVNGIGVNPADYSYEWSVSPTSGASLTDNNDGTCTVNYSATGTYAVSCTASKTGIATDSVRRSISTVIADLTPAFTVDVSDDGSGLVTLTGVSNTSQVNWGDNTTPTVVNGPTVEHFYTTNGTHDYTITASNANCSKEAEVSVMVGALEVVVTPSTSGVSFCPGQSGSVEFTAAVTIGTGYTYTWSVTDPDNLTTSDAGVGSPFTYNNFSKVGDYTVICTATKGTAELSTTATVTASYKVAPTFDDPTVSGRTVTLSNVVNTTSIDWGDETSTTEGIGETVSHTYSANSTGSGYHIIATSSVGCTKEDVYVPVSLTMGEIGTTGTLGTCNNGSTTVIYNATVNGIGVNPADYSYEWSVSPTSGASLTDNNDGTCTVNYSATGTYAVSCTASKTGIATDSVKRSINTEIADLTPVFAVEVSTDGSGLVTLNNVSNTNQVTWEENITNDQTTHTYTSTGTYVITATNTSVDPSCSKSETGVEVTVNPSSSISNEVHLTSSCVLNQSYDLVASQNVPSSFSDAEEWTGNGSEKGRKMKSNNQTYYVVDYVKDYDNPANWYSVVQIGSQCWMAENMRAKKAASYTPSPQTTSYHKDLYYYYSPNQSVNNVASCGYLYNFKAAVGYSSPNTGTNKGICPDGWHVPTNAEWQTMEGNYYTTPATTSGCSGDHAGKLAKESFWTQSSTENAPGNAALNSSGFGAVPAGRFIGSNPYYSSFGEGSYFWTSTVNGYYAYVRSISYNQACVNVATDNQYKAMSVRCVRD